MVRGPQAVHASASRDVARRAQRTPSAVANPPPGHAQSGAMPERHAGHQCTLRKTRRVCCVCHRVGHQYTPRQRAVSHPVSLSFTFTAAATCRHHASAAHYRARRFPTTCASHHARSSVPKRTHCTHAPSQPWRRLPTVTDARCSASHAGAADASLRRCFHVHAARAASKSTRATCPSQKHLSSSRTSVQFAGSRSRATKRRCSNGVLGRRRENWNVLRPR